MRDSCKSWYTFVFLHFFTVDLQQAGLLWERNERTRFVAVARALLAPYFYGAHRLARMNRDECA